MKTPVHLNITTDEFEAAYVMWMAGADRQQLSEAYGAAPLELSWAFLLRAAGKDLNNLGTFKVHFKDTK